MKKNKVNLKVDGLNICGELYLQAEKAKKPYPAVCLCHGIPSGTVDVTDGGYPLLAEQICEQGFAVFFLNFRGAGGSEGNFDILGWTRDLSAAIDYLFALPDIDKSRLSLLGFSAGGAVALCLAAEDKRIAGVVACASPASFTAIVEAKDIQLSINYFRKIGIIRDKEFPPSAEEWRNNFRRVSPVQSIASIAPRPLLLIHGTNDNIVPLDDARKLFAQAGEIKQLIVLEGAEHRLRRNEQAVALIFDWLKRVRCKAADEV